MWAFERSANLRKTEGSVIRLAQIPPVANTPPNPFPWHLNTKEGPSVPHEFPTPFIVLITLAFAICSQGVLAQNPQNPPASPQTPAQTQASPQPQPRSPGGDVGSGAGDIGKGTAKGTGAA